MVISVQSTVRLLRNRIPSFLKLPYYIDYLIHPNFTVICNIRGRPLFVTSLPLSGMCLSRTVYSSVVYRH